MKICLGFVILTGIIISGCSRGPSVDSLSVIESPAIKEREVTLPRQGSVKATVARLKKTLDEEVLVSAGVPFGVGQLKSDKDIAFFDNETEIPIATKVLARWPYDGSVRSVLVQFKVGLANKYKYKPMTMKWGQSRNTEDLPITEIDWAIPQAYIVLPAQWLCDSEIIGEQVPMDKNQPTEYDKKLLRAYPSRRDGPLTGDARKDFYYDTAHTFFQIYVRTGEPEYFVSGHMEALRYREDVIIKEGPERGNTEYKIPRYVFVQALADDYLLTGDERSLEVAGYMAEYLKNNIDPKKAFFPKKARHFWTERRYTFPFLGALTYYELTGDEEYLNVASQYMNSLYRTQMEWPDRGGFIHNLYSHDPEEGARRNEYGGSPFMTGLLLEPIIGYHRLTGSEIAKQSIFMALDWLIKEGLVPERDSFYYMTANSKKNEGGHPDLNLLIAHAFGYGYKISGYERGNYLECGRKIFKRGVNSAYVGTRKHFNQNFRSSAHFLAYVKDVNTVKTRKDILSKRKIISDIHPRLFITKKDLPSLRERFKNSPYWLKASLMKYADVSPYWKKQELLDAKTNVYDIVSLGFVYQLIGDEDYARQAIENMLNIAIKNETDLENFSLGFDWCYEEMTQHENDIIVSKMEKAGTRIMNKERYLRSFHNTMYELSTSIALCGYALEDESELAEEFIEFSELQYKDAILMFNNIFVDGGWSEGMDYNRHIAVPMIKYFEAVRTATGRDLYKECDWLLKNAYFVLYTTRPDNTFYKFADNDLSEITDWERRFLVRVASYYKDPYIQWYINYKTKPHSVVFKHIYDILWYDVDLKDKSLEDLPKARLFKGLGVAIARSGWGKDDTWFSFKCGDYFGDHAHLDNNSFTIYKLGDLAIDSGLYGDDFGSSHWTNYYSRTIAHNTITIYDPREKFYGYKRELLTNDGGQKIMLWQGLLNRRIVPENYKHKDPSLDLTWVENSDLWNTGEIVDFKATDDYCYVVGDATNSYSSEKLEKFERAVVFIYPDYFIILDRVSSTKRDFRKKWLLHTVNEPMIKNNEATIVEGRGKLFCKALYPSKYFINKIGGPGREFFVNGKNYPHNNKLFPGNIPGSWRIEIEPSEFREDDIFLNFLHVSVTGSRKRPEVKKIDADDGIGVSLELDGLKWNIIFRDGEAPLVSNGSQREY